MASDIRCPNCGSQTRLRTSSKDDCQYYVCIRYPQCKGRVEYDEEWDSDWSEEEPETQITHDRARYQQNDEMETDSAGQRVSINRDLKWGPTCLGAFVTVVLQFVVLQIIIIAISNISETTAVIVLLVTVLVSYICGGFLVGAMTREKGALHGILAAFIAWGSSLIITYMMGGYFLWSYSGDYAEWVILGMAVGLLLELALGSLGGFLGEKLRQHWS